MIVQSQSDREVPVRVHVDRVSERVIVVAVYTDHINDVDVVDHVESERVGVERGDALVPVCYPVVVEFEGDEAFWGFQD